MDGGPTKINPPNSHPSNPIHKQATQAQGLEKKPAPKPTPTQHIQTSAPAATPQEPPKESDDKIEPHHVNKAVVAVGVLALAGVIAWMR